MVKSKMALHRATYLSLVMLTAGCSWPSATEGTGERPRGVPSVEIATIASAKPWETEDLLMRVLKEEGIKVEFEGSLIFGVWVQEKDKERAIEIIKKHPELKKAGVYLDGEWREYVESRRRGT